MKKLRYASEFIAPAYGDALDPFIERMVKIQDSLGELQDTVFTKSFIDHLRDDWKGKLVDPELLFILGEIYQLQGEIARRKKEEFGRIWEEFSSAETALLLQGVLLREPVEEKGSDNGSTAKISPDGPRRDSGIAS
jgi:hypothetical protein